MLEKTKKGFLSDDIMRKVLIIAQTVQQQKFLQP